LKGTVDDKKMKVTNKIDFFAINSIVVFSALLVLMVGFIIINPYVETLNMINGLEMGTNAIGKLISFLIDLNTLPLWIIVIPLVAGPIQVFIGAKSEKLRDTVVVNTTFIVLLLILAMYPKVLQGTMVYKLPELLGMGLTFKVDMLSLIVALTTGILWVLVTMYSHDYMQVENHRNRFYLWMSVTFAGILGTVMAGDLFTMYLFFEMMTFSSYFLVAHNQNKEAIVAGRSYIYMSIVGGLSILLGMFLLYNHTSTLAFGPLAYEIQGLGVIKYLIAALFIGGFGVKAGILPLHVWLPRAHPVAPTPASSLLSGIMIKIGAYGILRVLVSYFMPSFSDLAMHGKSLWEASQNIGAVVIWIGIITMAVGVFMALQQGNMKRMLAYHSVSQMGYIIMGIGVAAYLGTKGAMGFSGGIYHMVNHALFKALLFMVVGMVYLRTKELDMYKLGGLWRKMPFTALLCLIAALGITGMPGFNGFASKSILHHAIIEAYEYGHASFKYAEIIFTVVSAGTVCSFIKLFGFVFLGKCPEEHKNIEGENRNMALGMAGLAILITAIGLAPNYMLDKFIIPAARVFAYDPAFIDKYIVGIKFFALSEIMGMVRTYLMGIGIFIIGVKLNLFHLHFPKWMSFENVIYKPIYKVIVKGSKRLSNSYEAAILENDIVLYLVVLAGMLFLILR
jgi:formate hydrogenlyase subunit 3/multisubunit Na+/H+ antiporter MnhD subunit